MKTIWKFAANLADEVTIPMPAGARVLHARAERTPYGEGTYDVKLAVWAVVEPSEPLHVRAFYVRGTGHPLGLVGDYVATAFDGPFVWHVFEAVYTTDHLEDS